MRLLQKMKEVMMFGPLNQVEKRLEESLTTEAAISDVTTHLVQLLAKHKSERLGTKVLNNYQLSFWTQELPDGKIAIDSVTLVNQKDVPSGVKNEGVVDRR